MPNRTIPSGFHRRRHTSSSLGILNNTGDELSATFVEDRALNVNIRSRRAGFAPQSDATREGLDDVREFLSAPIFGTRLYFSLS